MRLEGGAGSKADGEVKATLPIRIWSYPSVIDTTIEVSKEWYEIMKNDSSSP